MQQAILKQEALPFATTPRRCLIGEGERRRIVSTTQQLAEQVYAAFQQLGYRQLRTLHCKSNGATVTLQGTIGSFYLKQIAQSTAAKVEGVERVVNEIEVPDMTDSKTNRRLG